MAAKILEESPLGCGWLPLLKDQVRPRRCWALVPCSPKFSHFGVVVINSVMLYRWEILPKFTCRPVIHNTLTPHHCMGPLSHLWVRCTVDTKDLRSLLPKSNRHALLSCRVTWTILQSLSQAILLNWEQPWGCYRDTHLALRAWQSWCLLNVEFSALSCISLWFSPLPGISLGFLDNLQK